eukprot:6515175-Pyramimonas_sp.AAC.1
MAIHPAPPNQNGLSTIHDRSLDHSEAKLTHQYSEPRPPAATTGLLEGRPGTREGGASRHSFGLASQLSSHLATLLLRLMHDDTSKAWSALYLAHFMNCCS